MCTCDLEIEVSAYLCFCPCLLSCNDHKTFDTNQYVYYVDCTVFDKSMHIAQKYCILFTFMCMHALWVTFEIGEVSNRV